MSSPITFILDGFLGRPWRFERLADAIRTRGGRAEIFHYDSTGRTRFEILGRQLASAIHRAAAPVNLVGFSMGGLVIRAAHWIDRDLPIRRAAFLNSPLRGSALAYALPIGGIRQMRPTDPFIRSVQALQWQVPTLAVWCPFDTAVLPGRSARVAKASQTICCGLPVHIWPIYSTKIHAAVADFFTRESLN